MSERVVPCFHCGEPCPPGEKITVERDGATHPMCCYGCQAVFELIYASGLDRYYEFRTEQARKADEDPDRVAELWAACDTREDLWGEADSDGMRDLLLQTEGVQCAACAWLIRSRLEPRQGVARVQVDVGTGYTRILWDPRQTRLSDIALQLVRIGYRPHLPIAEAEERERLKERRSAMLRVGVAGLGMMQVMMYAVGLYSGEALGISAGAHRFLEWTSLIVTIPVVFYSAQPFFTAAAASLRARRLNMDVPVSLAIAVAFIASLVNFLRSQGDVYFDSVVMFVFFLSSARYIQLVQRHRNLQGGAALARLLPDWAQRVRDDVIETVLASELTVGDSVRVRAGEPFPADGTLIEGATEVDEALLTGESAPVARAVGDAVVGGSINRAQPVEVRVDAVGRDLTVSALGRMLLRAGGQASRFITASERIASYFVAGVLIIAALTAAGWLYFSPAGALPAVLAVLVVSCPCALSLAAPAAMAAAGRSLLRRGVLMTRGDALEALAGTDIAVFDKTGTLTRGMPVIEAVHLNPMAGVDEARVRAIAAGLEAHSAHPLARAFRQETSVGGLDEVETVNHAGVRATIDGERWSIGNAEFTGVNADMGGASPSVWLANEQGWVARFDISDGLRPGAKALIGALRERGTRVVIASGDRPEAVERIAGHLGVEEWHAQQDPEQKMRRVREWQEAGAVVAMIGDGVNDAPVLATADVSITVPGASELANSAADFILTGESLEGVLAVADIARTARHVIRQNFGWAIGYNVAALPLAVFGVLQPWMAALGMSLSSLLVVANSVRLSRVESAGVENVRPAGDTVPA